jgi:hypothetical protein
MTRNAKIEQIEAAETLVAQFTQEEADYRRSAIESDGIDEEEQATLDRINQKITDLTDRIATLRAEIERNRAIWEGRASDLAQLRSQVAEVTAFGLPSAEPIASGLTEIDQSVSDQRWADATSQLDVLLANFEPVMADYTAQTDAMAEYTPLRASVDSRLAAVRADATPEMSRSLSRFDRQLAGIDSAVAEKDFVQALEDLNDLISDLEPLEDQIQAAAVGTELNGATANVGGAEYEVGPPQRPTIQHDNGFLQNPNDPDDPNPMPTREPTDEERSFYASEVVKATGAGILTNVPGVENIDSRLGLDNALAGYRHFLTGEGEDFTFDYESYLEDDASGQQFKRDVTRDIQNAVNSVYADLPVELPDSAGATVSFPMHGEQPAGGPPYPATEDWQKAIGGHSAWSNSEITLTRQDDGTIAARAVITLEAEDRYNFNPGQNDIATGAPDQLRGVLEESGLAQQFTQTGRSTFESTWTIGTPTPSAPDDEVAMELR